MQSLEILNWAGLVCVLSCGLSLSIIGFRNSVLFRSPKPRLLKSPLEPLDIKLAKISGLLFLLGVVFFILGALF